MLHTHGAYKNLHIENNHAFLRVNKKAGCAKMLRGRGHAEKGGAAAGASVNTVAVQRNWAERDFVQGVQVGVAQLTAFLNGFGARARAHANSSCAHRVLLFPALLRPACHTHEARAPLVPVTLPRFRRGNHPLEARCSGWKALKARAQDGHRGGYSPLRGSGTRLLKRERRE